MTPQTNQPTQQTAQGTIVSPAPAHTPSTFSKLMSVMEALEPLILAGVSPFIKNAETQVLIQNEAPVAQALFQALSAL